MASLSKRTRIPLAHPVTVEGVRYAELRARSAKSRDLTRLGIVSGQKLEIGIALAARLCGVPEAVIYALDPADAERVGVEVDALISRIL